jgi:hypothetical protein
MATPLSQAPPPQLPPTTITPPTTTTTTVSSTTTTTTTNNDDTDRGFWFGEKWRKSQHATTPTPCTREYVARLRGCSPAALVAHSYTRYMGDLSGGRVLMKRAQKSLALSGEEGSAFYIFDVRALCLSCSGGGKTDTTTRVGSCVRGG